jgi:hypothetical protein
MTKTSRQRPVAPPIDQITLRDFFAAAALTGLLANSARCDAAEMALIFADEMLEARAKEIDHD